MDRFGTVDALIHNFGPFHFARVKVSDYRDDHIRGMDKMASLSLEKADEQVESTLIGGDVARMIAFLCDTGSAHLSGTVTTIHGGGPVILKDL